MFIGSSSKNNEEMGDNVHSMPMPGLRQFSFRGYLFPDKFVNCFKVYFPDIVQIFPKIFIKFTVQKHGQLWSEDFDLQESSL